MVICFGSVPFTLFLRVGELPEFVSLMSLDRSNWPRCLLWLVVLMRETLGRLLLETWLAVSWSVVWVLILEILLLFGLRLNTGTLLHWKCVTLLIYWTDGCREDFSSIGGF